jgi:DNA-binding MarR family transcriptional regulator
MKKDKPDNLSELSWDEISYLSAGFAFASQPLMEATKAVAKQYSLGPRGAWILRLIAGKNVSPSELTEMFRVGRSLISAELSRLTDAGLITYTKNEGDQRRVELALTKLGEQANRRVRADLVKIVRSRLASYSREEILLCSRMLHDFIGSENIRHPFQRYKE